MSTSKEDNFEPKDNEREILPVILDGTFFKITSKTGDKVEAKCLKCTKTAPKIISGSLSGTTNFLVHLKRVHPESVQEYQNRKQELGPSLKKQRKEAINESNGNEKPKQMALTNFVTVTPKSKPRSKIDRLILSFILKGMHPLVVVEEEGFRDLVSGLSDGKASVPSRRTLTRQLDEDYKERNAVFIKELEQIPYICMTADCWTCGGKSRAFLGVTIHWITDDLIRHSAVLACKRFTGTHSYDKIAGMLCDIMKSHGIQPQKVQRIVTDNGSNFAKAFREYAYDPSVGEEPDENDDDELLFNSIENAFQATDVIRLPPNQPCASHSLSLICVTDVSKIIRKSPLAKCYGIWNKIWRSTHAAEIVKEECGRQLTTPCPTRWNSLYDCISLLLQFRSNLETICERLALPTLRETDLTYLEKYKMTMKPIAVALDRLQGEHRSFYGELVPTIFTIEKKLKQQETEDECCPQLTKCALASLRKRFNNYLALESKYNDAYVASVCHPFFKTRWINNEEDISKLRNLFIATVLEMELQTSSRSKTSSQGSNQEYKPQKDDEDYFAFTEDAVSDVDEHVQSENALRLQCHQYLEDKATNLSMLHKYPNVKQAFIKYNTTLPSSAPVGTSFQLCWNDFNTKKTLPK